MSYYNSAAGVRITEERVLHELCVHGCPHTECQLYLKDNPPGNDGLYSAQDVLNFLGY